MRSSTLVIYLASRAAQLATAFYFHARLATIRYRICTLVRKSGWKTLRLSSCDPTAFNTFPKLSNCLRARVQEFCVEDGLQEDWEIEA